MNNLKNIGLAFRIFATDNGDRFPFELSSGDGGTQDWATNAVEMYRHFQALSNELSTPKIVICPSDAGKTEATNWTTHFTNLAKGNGCLSVSYSVGTDAAETFPQSFLSTDRNMTNNVDRKDLTKAPSNANQFVDMGGVGGPKAASITQGGGAGWDNNVHQNQGNGCMGDGSVQQLSGARLRDQLRNSGTTENKFLFPAAAK